MKFGTKVKVLTGYHTKREGRVVDHRERVINEASEFRGARYTDQYLVDFDDSPPVWIEGRRLTKLYAVVNIPNPDCPRCEGVGWYEGGKTMKTDCHCLKKVTKASADQYVTHGSLNDWKTLYDNA